MNAAVIGGWIGGFIIPMAVAYVFLRLASRGTRNAPMFRVLAVAAAVFLAFASYVGGGYINPGAVMSVITAIAWAAMQSRRRA